MKPIIRIAFSLALGAFATTLQAGVIDTTTGWNGTSNIGTFGEVNTATYGQTFRVGADSQLDSWTFYLNDRLNPDYTDFAFYVMDWNQAAVRATGPILYQSAAVSTTNNGGLGGMEAFTFATGGLGLTSGNNYVAFISSTGLFDGSQGTSFVGSRRDENAYADGGFFWLNNGANANQWTTQRWNSRGNFGDLAFVANFSSAAVPEPGTISLLGLGVLGMCLARRKRS